MRLKEIKNYNGKYFISDNGIVFKKENDNLIEIKPFFSHNGYLRIKLIKNGKSYNCARSNAKLNRTEVEYIKKNYKKGNGTEIAKKLNVDLSMVVKIAKGKAYNWINER